jgi:putative flippase GtrA
MEIISQETRRFVVAGGLNTIFGYFLYLALLIFFDYYIAYTVSFFASIIIAFFINGCYVFKTRILWKRIAHYPVLYILQYFVGLIFIFILISWCGVSEKIAPIVNAALLTPLSFIANKWFFLKG